MLASLLILNYSYDKQLGEFMAKRDNNIALKQIPV